MINYEKIKLGKGLTKNQKRLREIYLQHKLNLEGEEIKETPYINGHKVRIISSNIDVKCSRKLGDTFIVYDGLQKENIQVRVEERTRKDWRRGYVDRWDEVYVILGKRNIIYHKHNNKPYVLRLYNNYGVFDRLFIEINHRKKDVKDMISYESEVFKNAMSEGGI